MMNYGNDLEEEEDIRLQRKGGRNWVKQITKQSTFSIVSLTQFLDKLFPKMKAKGEGGGGKRRREGGEHGFGFFFFFLNIICM